MTPAARMPARGGSKRGAPAGGGAPKKTRVVCISHKEDADGISSAALVRQAFGGDSVLVDYPGQMEAIERVSADAALKSLYICDLGLSKRNQDQFVEIMSGLRRRRVSVTYVDHHDMDARIARKLREIKVRVIHDTNECTAVLAYNAFKSKLGAHATFVAACAAVTDYMEDRPLGARLLQIYDRQFALISATVLTYNIVGHQKDEDYLLRLVGELADSRYPHQIPGAYGFAQLQVEKLAGVMEEVRRGLKRMSNLGHMEILESGAGGAVNFVLGLSGRDVGVAYKERADHGVYAVSVRGAKGCKAHLGRIINSLAADLGGSGGGHDRACGAVIPRAKIRTFLREFNRRLDA